MKSLSYLRNFNIKPSHQRLAIMEYLLDHCCSHPTATQIYNALSPSMPTLTRTTVYKTLKLLADHKAILMLTIDEDSTRFDADNSPHAHFFCKKCTHIYDLPLPPGIKYVEEQKMDGHKVTEMHLYYKGTCRDCLAKK